MKQCFEVSRGGQGQGIGKSQETWHRWRAAHGPKGCVPTAVSWETWGRDLEIVGQSSHPALKGLRLLKPEPWIQRQDLRGVGGSPGLHTCAALSGFPALFSLLVSALTVSDARPASVCLFNSPQTLLSYFITTYRDPVIKSCRDRYPRWDHLHALHHHLPGLGHRPQSPPNWPPALLLGTRLHSPHHTHSQL